MRVHTLELRGWPRTVVLAGGAVAGTLLTAGAIHLAKKGRPEKGPRGWGRTALLATGAFGGVVLTAGAIHVVKGGQGSLSKSKSMFEFMRSLAPDRYHDALAEAARIEEATGIPMIVEGLKPSHFGWTEFVLPVGIHSMTLKDNVRFYPVGIFSTDTDFTTLKWWRGARIGYIADWPVFYVPQTKEKQATMTPQPVFKTSFTFEVVSSDPGRIRVHAWILGYVVLPETMREMKVTR